MPFAVKVAAAAFAFHSLVPIAATAIWVSNGNEAALGALIVVCLADAPLIPVFKRLADWHANVGVVSCLWVSFLLGGLLHAMLASGLAMILRRAMRS